MPPIFVCASSSTFLVASLKAAITRSCSISTSPATSGSIFTPSDVLVAVHLDGDHAAAGRGFHANQRDLLLHLLLHLLGLLHHGLHVSGHLHSLYPCRVTARLLLQISHGADLRVREQFLEALHVGMRQRALAQVGCFDGGRGGLRSRC